MANTIQPTSILTFDNLAQRVMYRFSFTFADFVPIDSETVSVDTQRAFYELCKSMIGDIADDPSLVGLPTDHPDEWMRAHDVMNRHPELYKVRNACLKMFNELYGLLFAAGLCGKLQEGKLILSQSDMPKLAAKTIKTYTAFLERYGLCIETTGDGLSFAFPQNPDILAAWQLLAAKCSGYSDKQRDNATQFALWLHHNDGTYFLERLKALLGLDDGFFSYIAEKYLAMGYGVKYTSNEYGTQYEYLRDIGGLRIEYNTLWPTVRFVSSTCIGIKAILENADVLSEGIKPLLVDFCKKCDDCMGCTKGGKNKKFDVTINAGGTDYRLCPQFMQMEWYNSDISREKIDFLLELNELQERFGKNWKKR